MSSVLRGWRRRKTCSSPAISWVDGVGHRALHHRRRHGETSAHERLTEHSVYARVLPATRREINGEAPMPTPPTRRQFLARAAILAAGAPSLGAVLQACSKSTPSSSAPSLTLAAPDNPVKWDIADDNKPIADGLAPEKGATLQLYSYADYISPDAVKAFGDKYGVQVRDLDVQRHRRGDHQDPRRQCRLRPLLPELRPDQPAGVRQADSAAEPQLHPEHQERVAELHQPLVRPGLALHRAVHHLHHRHRLA